MPRKKSVFAERLPREAEVENAKQLQDIIESQVRSRGTVCLSTIDKEGRTETVTLKPKITRALLELLWLISSGKGADVVPLDTHVTPNKAADMLGMNRPQMVRLLDEGEIPYIVEGRHRRIPVEEVFAYRKTRRERSEIALRGTARLIKKLHKHLLETGKTLS